MSLTFVSYKFAMLQPFWLKAFAVIRMTEQSRRVGPVSQFSKYDKYDNRLTITSYIDDTVSGAV